MNEKDFRNLVQKLDLNELVIVMKENKIIPYNDEDIAIQKYSEWVANYDKNTKIDDTQMINHLLNAIVYLRKELSNER